MRTHRHQIADRGSRGAAVLEEAWTELRKLVPGLPPVVITLMNSVNTSRLGYVHPHQWRTAAHTQRAPEVAISPKLFYRAKDALAVLLHEAGHALLLDAEHPLGCGDRYYHRKEFRNVVRQLGLTCEFRNNRYGWVETGWPKNVVPVRYKTVVNILNALPKGTSAATLTEPRKRPLPNTGHLRLVCACPKPRSIYVGKETMKTGGIVCRLCGREFQSGKDGVSRLVSDFSAQHTGRMSSAVIR